MDNFGAVIKNARLQAGLTRKELADNLGISPRHLKNIENNHKKPSLKLLHHLIRELSIPADLIFHPGSGITPDDLK